MNQAGGPESGNPRDAAPSRGGEAGGLGSAGRLLGASADLGELIVRSMQDGFSLLDLQGRHVYVNPALSVMTGFTHEELVGAGPPHPYWPPEEYENIQRAFQQTLEGIRHEFDLVFMRKGGERFPVSVNAFPVVDTRGMTVGYSATVRNMTERRRAELELLEAHQRMRLHVEKTPIAVIEWDLGFRVTQWNPAAERIFGYTQAEALGRHASFIIPDQSRHLVDHVWHELVRKAGGERATNENVRRDGTLILCEWYNTPLVDDRGVVTAVASLAMDVTKRVRAEEEQRALTRSLEQRVTERTRDLESAFSELLRRNTQLRTMAVKLAEAENSERRRIARLLHDEYQQLLVAARMKSEVFCGQLEGPPEQEFIRGIIRILDQAIDASRTLAVDLAPPILIDAAIDAALRWLARWMKEHHGLEVDVQGALPDEQLPLDINMLLFQAVREFLFNVAKHAGVDKACVTLARDNEGIRVTVADDGLGFDAGQALDQGQTFGLFHIRERLALVDGRIEVVSAPGRGTTVTLVVPVAAASTKPVAADEGSERDDEGAVTQAPGRGRRIRLLVADDHSVVRQGLIQVLGRARDIEVVGEAVNGQEAVEKARLLDPHVVLMDVTMPKLNGLEATRILSTRYPRIKVVGLSMHEKDDMRSSMLAAGAVDYLSKSRPIEDLLASIRQAAGGDAGAVDVV